MKATSVEQERAVVSAHRAFLLSRQQQTAKLREATAAVVTSATRAQIVENNACSAALLRRDMQSMRNR